MKKLNPVLFFCLALLAYSCVKEDVPEAEPLPKPEALFGVTKNCNRLLLPDTVQFLDSALLFLNASDTGQRVSYRWDFGDLTSSTEFSPSHAYSKPGVYPVRLITYNDQQPSDTFVQQVRIIIGQKEFKTAQAYTDGVAVEEAAHNGALVLLSHTNAHSEPSSFSLLLVDSLLRQKWMKPVGGSGVRLASLKKINAEEYILSGNYTAGNTEQFALSKINGNGDLLWTQYIANLPGSNRYTLPTSDGGFITVGNTGDAASYATAVVKCDANGKEVWRRIFDGSGSTIPVWEADNILETTAGFEFAALSGNWFDATIVVTRLDRQGAVLKQSEVAAGNTGTIFSAGIARTANSVLVYASNTPYVFLFDGNLSFVERPRVGESGLHAALAHNGQFYLAEGSHQYAYVRQLAPGGTQNWATVINHNIITSCNSLFSGATRYCQALAPIGGKEVIALSRGENAASSSAGYSVYLEKFLADGQVK